MRTVRPISLDPFYSTSLYKMGQDVMNIQYKRIFALKRFFYADLEHHFKISIDINAHGLNGFLCRILNG